MMKLDLPEEVLKEAQAFLEMLMQPAPTDEEIAKQDSCCDTDCDAEETRESSLVAEVKEEGVREFLAGLIDADIMAKAETIGDLKEALATLIRKSMLIHQETVNDLKKHVTSVAKILSEL